MIPEEEARLHELPLLINEEKNLERVLHLVAELERLQSMQLLELQSDSARSLSI